MNPRILSVVSVVSIALLLAGCDSAQTGTSTSPLQPQHADHVVNQGQKVSFAKLSTQDRPLAEAQGYCAVTSEPLGSMGPPIKLNINKKPVFVCCKGCEKKAKSRQDSCHGRGTPG